MAKQAKPATNTAPSPETLAAVPAKRRGKGPARPSMKAPDPAGMTVVQQEQGAIVDTRTREQIVVQDVNSVFDWTMRAEQEIGKARVGPEGYWTVLVRRFVFNYKDWKGIRDLFKATLTAKLREQVKQENPMDSFPGLDEPSYIAMVNEMVEQRMKGSFSTKVSEFDVIGRAFAVDKHGKPTSIGRDGILAVLEGRKLSDTEEPPKLDFRSVLSRARNAVGKSNRGRKAGSTNKNPAPVADETDDEDTPKQSGTMAKVETDYETARAKAREANVQNILRFLDSLPNDAAILAPIVVRLGNKLKASEHKDAVDLGLLMVDLAIGEVIPQEEKPAKQTKPRGKKAA